MESSSTIKVEPGQEEPSRPPSFPTSPPSPVYYYGFFSILHSRFIIPVLFVVLLPLQSMVMDVVNHLLTYETINTWYRNLGFASNQDEMMLLPMAIHPLLSSSLMI
jgi:hypothetical protein